MARKAARPPLPDSTGMVSAMRWSKAPATKAPLPYREQPVTPVASALSTLPPDCAMTSMIRLTPQAQAPGAAGRAVQGVERALLAAARHALAAHRERVVADDGGAGGLDGGGVRAEAAEDDHGGKGPEPLGRSTPAEKLALRP